MSASLNTAKLSDDTIKLTMSWDAVEELFAELLNAPLDVRKAVLDGLEAGTEFICIKSNVFATSGAPKVVVTLEPSDAFLALVAAAGAGN